MANPLVLVVRCEVQEQHLEAFLAEVTSNAGNARKEPGCLRFDVLQHKDNKLVFVLYEQYRDEAALEAHRNSAHFARWRDVAVPMLKGDRQRDLFECISNSN
jgi:autoinducer 2-degrading protein